MKKFIKNFISIVIFALLGIGAYYLLTILNENIKNQKSQNFAKDLQTSFYSSMQSLDLPKESIFMANSYYGNESQKESNFDFADPSLTNQFYMASTVKPFYIAAFINLLSVKSLDYKVPFTFVEEPLYKWQIASEISDYIQHGYEEDDLLVKYIVPFFSGVEKEKATPEFIYDELIGNPMILNYQFSLRDIIRSTLGPSSNWGLTILRNHLALKKYGTEEGASQAVEDYLNNFLKQNNVSSNLRLNLSANSKRDKTFNTDYFYEVEYLFEFFYEHKFNINKDIFDSMKNSMRNVSDEPVTHNRSHEIKSIASSIFGSSSPDIIEKSGYIGLDYESAPGLNAVNGWNDLKTIDGKRIVFFTASDFSRIQLENGRFVQFNYSIRVPLYISLDPKYEE